MDLEKCTIFYTDDDEDDLFFFKAAGGEISSDLQITTSINGEALTAQPNNPPPTPDIILLDLNIPRKNGFEIVCGLKNCADTKNPPVIIFSASDDNSSIASSSKLGANIYIPKPLSLTKLKKLIRHAISINRAIFNPYRKELVFRIN